jgi:hypothetical protein
VETGRPERDRGSDGRRTEEKFEPLHPAAQVRVFEVSGYQKCLQALFRKSSIE